MFYQIRKYCQNTVRNDHNFKFILVLCNFFVSLFNVCFLLIDRYPSQYYIISIIGMCDTASSGPRDNRPTGETLKLYQQIVIKNFQILKNLLPRMNSIYQLNEELQRSVSNIENRLVKMENDQENLHYEMRTTHLAIDSKLTTIIVDYNNITNETNKMKKHTQSLSREIKEAKTKHYIERSQIEIDMQSIPVKEKTQEKTKKIAFAQKDEVFPHLLKNRSKRTEFSRKSSIQMENLDASFKINKVHFDIAPSERGPQEIEPMSQSFANQPSLIESNKRTALKSKKSQINPTSVKSVRQIKTSKSIQHIQPADNKSFEKFLREIENYHFHNQKMKQNYEQLMQEYCKKNQINFKELNQKINALNARLNQFDPQNNPLESIKTAINLQLQPKFQQIAASIQEKIDRKMFERIMTEFNTRILGIHQERKKTANRDETKRALQFLEKKINGVLNDYYQAKQRSVHHVQVDKKGCLRAADLLNERVAKDYNRSNILQSQTAANTPRMPRNDSARTTKRQASSLHARIMNGTLTQNRFNEKEWMGISTQKGDTQQESSTQRQQESRNIHFLKKKTHEILDKEKAKGRPKLKKQRLIFQYD